MNTNGTGIKVSAFSAYGMMHHPERYVVRSALQKMPRAPGNTGQRCKAFPRQRKAVSYGKVGKNRDCVSGVESPGAVIVAFSALIAELRTSARTTPGEMVWRGQKDPCTECATGAENKSIWENGCARSAESRA